LVLKDQTTRSAMIETHILLIDKILEEDELNHIVRL
jgi:hypothetical protein